nr:hypothetical protein JVH1_7692 [Rhodococcus sp. JVH1]
MRLSFAPAIPEFSQVGTSVVGVSAGVSVSEITAAATEDQGGP